MEYGQKKPLFLHLLAPMYGGEEQKEGESEESDRLEGPLKT